MYLFLQNESEILPFPNKEVDFSLPDTSDFADLQNRAFPRLIAPRASEDNKQDQKSDSKQDQKTDKHEKSDSGEWTWSHLGSCNFDDKKVENVWLSSKDSDKITFVGTVWSRLTVWKAPSAIHSDNLPHSSLIRSYSYCLEKSVKQAIQA